MSCEQSNFSMSIPFVGEGGIGISFETQGSITVTFVASSGYHLTGSITYTPIPDPPPTGLTPPSINQTASTITFYDPGANTPADYEVSVGYDEDLLVLETPASTLTFKPRNTCPS